MTINITNKILTLDQLILVQFYYFDMGEWDSFCNVSAEENVRETKIRTVTIKFKNMQANI